MGELNKFVVRTLGGGDGYKSEFLKNSTNLNDLYIGLLTGRRWKTLMKTDYAKSISI